MYAVTGGVENGGGTRMVRYLAQFVKQEIAEETVVKYACAACLKDVYSTEVTTKASGATGVNTMPCRICGVQAAFDNIFLPSLASGAICGHCCLKHYEVGRCPCCGKGVADARDLCFGS